MDEIWKPVVGFEKYAVSNLGRIRNPYGKLLKPSVNRKGYLKVRLYDGNSKHKEVFVHRAVAITFLPNPDNLPQINHINYDKSDNKVVNLEWCDNQYNQRYSFALPVDVYNLDGNLIGKYSTITDAANDKNVPTTNISKCCKGNILTCNELIFLYENDDITARLAAVKNKFKVKCKKVCSYDLAGTLLKRFNSVGDAARYYHFSPKSVINCCKLRKNNNQKIIFKYE